MTTDLDLNAIRARAMLLRNVLAPEQERRVAVLQASDDLLAMIAEIERLRAVLTPESADLARRLAALRLWPSGKGPQMELLYAIARLIHRYAIRNAPKGWRVKVYAKRLPLMRRIAYWDSAAGPAAADIMCMVGDYLEKQIGYKG